MQRASDAAPHLREVAHTADAGFEVEAPDLAGLFERAGLGLLALVADLDAVEARESRALEARGRGLVEVLHAFLSRILLAVPLDRFLGCALDVGTAGDDLVVATLLGEPLDLTRHRLHGEVKAVTWHELGVERRGAGWWARVIVDV